MKITLDSKLTLHQPPGTLAKRIRDTFTIENPQWRDNERMGRWNGSTQRLLTFYGATPEEITLPRGTLGLVLFFCKELGVRFDIDNRTRTLPAIPFTFTGELRPYQQKAVNSVLAYDFGVLQAPTGSGKTTMALAAISARKQPCLIIVHNKELLNQWRERITQFLGIPGADIGVIGGGKFKIGEKITIAIVNSLYPVAKDIRHHFGMIVVDECHRAPSRTFSEAVSAFDSKYMLGLSATPFRRDGLTKLIGWHLGRTVKVDATELTEQDIVQNVKVVVRQTGFISDCDAAEEYSRALSELTEDQQRNRQIVGDVVKEIGTGVCLLLTDRRDHCETLGGMLIDKGVHADILTGETPKRERESIVERLGAGKVNVLIATGQLIGEGFDAKMLQTLFITTPIKFSGRLIQYIGRILRPAPGKESAVIFDYVDGKEPVLAASFAARRRVYESKDWQVN